MTDEDKGLGTASARPDERRAHAWLDKWQVGESDGANLAGPLLGLLDEVRTDERRRASPQPAEPPALIMSLRESLASILNTSAKGEGIAHWEDCDAYGCPEDCQHEEDEGHGVCSCTVDVPQRRTASRPHTCTSCGGDCDGE